MVVLWALLVVPATAALRDALEAVPPKPQRDVVQEAMELLSEALRIASTIGDDWDRARALIAIARIQAMAGDSDGAAQSLAEALGIARSISRSAPEVRAKALSDIAQAQAKAGDNDGAARSFDEARRLARSIGDDLLRAKVLIAIVRTKVETANES